MTWSCWSGDLTTSPVHHALEPDVEGRRCHNDSAGSRPRPGGTAIASIPAGRTGGGCGMAVGKSILDAIGCTPLIEVQRFSSKDSVRIYAKLEGHNPTGSVKDRIAREMIEKAEADGEL